MTTSPRRRLGALRAATHQTAVARTRPRALVLLAAVLALLGPVATSTAAAPGQVSPRSSTTAPGHLESARPISLKSYPGTRAWHVLYRSTGATGRPDTVSGTVIAPANASASTAIVGYAPGTLGLADRCAMSRNLEADHLGEPYFVQKYTSLGYAVAITDYEGLGTPGKHTYNVGRSEGHAVLDVVRAAQHLPGSNLSPRAPVSLAGYSQGGFASGWAVQIASHYAPEIDLRGASVGAPPADLRRNIDFLDGTRYFGLELAAIYGLDAAYPSLHLEQYLNAKGRAAFQKIGTQCDDELVVRSDGSPVEWAGHELSEYTTRAFLGRADWRARMKQSSLGRRAPHVPVLLYNSKVDDIVPFETVSALRSRWCRRGADVTFYAPKKTGGHGLTGFAMAGVATGWTSARLLGLPVQHNC